MPAYVLWEDEDQQEIDDKFSKISFNPMFYKHIYRYLLFIMESEKRHKKWPFLS